MSASSAISGKSWSRIVARAWTDDAFKDRLLAEPKAVLLEHGIETEGDVRVTTDTGDDGVEACERDATVHLILPPPPSGLFEEELVPTGVAFCGCGGCHRCGRCGCGCGGCGICGICQLCG